MGGMYVHQPCTFGDCEDPLFPVVPGRHLLVENQVDRRGPPNARFPRRSWDPDFYGLVIYAEFSQQRWADVIRLDPPPANESDQTQREIQQLLAFAQAQRPAMLPEIKVQDRQFPSYFERLLMISPASHPATFDLMKVAARCSEMLMAHFKWRFSRPRPQQLAPALMPPLMAQNHASYPSGHAMMSRLMALCLSDAAGDEFEPSLLQLSEQIGRNREIAGVHYPSDTNAGQDVAAQAHRLLNSGPLQLYNQLVNEAREEWGRLLRDDQRWPVP